MACESLVTLNKFKKSFLSSFDETDDKDVNTYLRCEVVRDRANRTLRLRQSVYAEHVLKLHD
eukprot:1695731-Rhodomonas_salina.1